MQQTWPMMREDRLWLSEFIKRSLPAIDRKVAASGPQLAFSRVTRNGTGFTFPEPDVVTLRPR